MEAISLFLGILLMLVAAIGTLFYVALVIAIPVCRLLDWLAEEQHDEGGGQPSRPAMPRKSTRPWKKPDWVGSLRWSAFTRYRPDSEDES